METSWHTYPKLFAIGHRAVADLLLDSVIVEEKIDGSQFSFGRFNGELRLRSRGKQFTEHDPEKMFISAVNAVKELDLTDGYTYRGEYLQKPKHNTLCYDRIPEKHVIIFDINNGHESYLSYDEKKAEAERIGMEVVPILYQGKIESAEQIKQFLTSVSCLGRVEPEGVVIKNYKRFGPDGKALMAKFVSELFKEVHRSDWDKRHPTNGDIIESLGQTYKAEARWLKAMQRLRDNGQLLHEPKDIPALLKETSRDIHEECADEIKEQLFKWAWPKLQRIATRGIPQWYKEKLMESQFEKELSNEKPNSQE